MKKYLIKSGNNITLIEEDWKQSIIADTYTYLFVAVLAFLLYSYTSNFGRSVIFELAFVLFLIITLHSMFKKTSKYVNPEEAKKVVDDFFF